jgi:vacuolar-type H+-ATPase subunit I/STV1
MALHKILKIITILLGAIGIVYLGMVIWEGDEAIRASGDSLVGGFLWVAYITGFITLLLVVIFVIRGLATGNVKSTVIPIVAFLVIVLVAYMIADGTPMQLREGDTLSARGAKWVDTGLILFYITGAIAVVSMVIGSFKKEGR